MGKSISNQGQSTDGQSIANPPLGQVALPIEPCCNCHQGQRNILVDAQVTGNRKPISSGHVFAFNHTEKEAEFVVKMVERQGDKILSPAVLQQWKSGLHGQIPLHPAKTRAKDFGVEGKTVSRCHQGKVLIPAKGRVPLTIHAEYDPHEPVGTIHVFEVTQEDAHGGVFGGVTFAPCSFLDNNRRLARRSGQAAPGRMGRRNPDCLQARPGLEPAIKVVLRRCRSGRTPVPPANRP